MITVKITCDTGNTWSTRIKATFEEAQNYFIGSKFVRESDSGQETIDTCTKIELI